VGLFGDCHEQRTHKHSLRPARARRTSDGAPGDEGQPGRGHEIAAFREALRKDDEREAQADFQPDSGIFGQTGASADAPKTDPMTSQAREEKKARKENGY